MKLSLVGLIISYFMIMAIALGGVFDFYNTEKTEIIAKRVAFCLVIVMMIFGALGVINLIQEP